MQDQFFIGSWNGSRTRGEFNYNNLFLAATFSRISNETLNANLMINFYFEQKWTWLKFTLLKFVAEEPVGGGRGGGRTTTTTNIYVVLTACHYSESISGTHSNDSELKMDLSGSRRATALVTETHPQRRLLLLVLLSLLQSKRAPAVVNVVVVVVGRVKRRTFKWAKLIYYKQTTRIARCGPESHRGTVSPRYYRETKQHFRNASALIVYSKTRNNHTYSRYIRIYWR